MNASVRTDELAEMRAQVEDLERENKRLRKELRDEEERTKDAENERDDLQREVNEYTSHERKAQDANHQALAHARMLLENLVAKVDADLIVGVPVGPSDVFAHLMNRRAIDAITELIGR